MDDGTKYSIQDIPQDIRDFLEEILRTANMTSLDQQTHDDLLVEMYARLDDYMISTIMQELPPEKLEEFTKMGEDGKSREELQQYLQAHIPNSTEIFANAMIDFRSLYLGGVSDARENEMEQQNTAEPTQEETKSE